jgi:hypothetical protein
MLVCVSGVRKVSCHVNVCSRCQESELSCQCVLEVSGKLVVMSMRVSGVRNVSCHVNVC